MCINSALNTLLLLLIALMNEALANNLSVAMKYALAQRSPFGDWFHPYPTHHHRVHLRSQHSPRRRSVLDSHLPNQSLACTNKTQGDICNRTHGKICQNSKCVSACTLKNFKPCECPDANDQYCYLCCGNANNECRPAHQHQIFRGNGERWERRECNWCRTGLSVYEGARCDDKDNQRVCLEGRCVGGICKAAPEGTYCYNGKIKQQMCINGECRDPCREHNMEMCECDVASQQRCQLCCFSWQSQRCVPAYTTFSIKHPDGRPYLRIGLPCGRYDYTCNRLGRCRATAIGYSNHLLLLLSLLLHIAYRTLNRTANQILHV